MRKINFNYVIWLCKSVAKQLGFWGMFGAALIVASTLFYLVKVQDIKQNIEIARVEKQSQLKKTREFSTQNNAVKPQNNLDEVTQFYARFPSMHALPKILATLNDIAEKQNIELSVGDYKLNELKATKVLDQHELTKYEITFPMSGQYLHIRAFITEALKTFPEIALIDLQVVRDGSTSTQVEATLVFAVYVKVTA